MPSKSRRPLSVRSLPALRAASAGIETQFGIQAIVRLVEELTALKSAWEAEIQEARELKKAAQVMQKGERGAPGPRGFSVKGERGPQGPRGPKGDPGRDGKDGETPAVDIEEIVGEVLKRVPTAEVPAAEFDDEKVFGAIKKKKLKLEDIEDFDTKILDGVRKSIPAGLLHGGGDTVAAGANITITNVDGKRVISASGASVASWQTPPETPDGVTTVFTVASEPTDVVADGVSLYDGAGYTYAALTITFDNPPAQFVRYR